MHIDGLYHPNIIRQTLELHAMLPKEEVADRLQRAGIPFASLKAERINLEDAFIGLTGKY
jgi:ABC-2 type transport system ATP-binding protein